MDTSDMRTFEVKIVSMEVDDDFVVVKTMHVSSVVYKDNRVLSNKKLSHYLLSMWVDYDWKKKERIDAIRQYIAFKENDYE